MVILTDMNFIFHNNNLDNMRNCSDKWPICNQNSLEKKEYRKYWSIAELLNNISSKICGIFQESPLYFIMPVRSYFWDLISWMTSTYIIEIQKSSFCYLIMAIANMNVDVSKSTPLGFWPKQNYSTYCNTIRTHCLFILWLKS